jgi:hypothetical protein
MVKSVREIGQTSFLEVLKDWAFHECQGKNLAAIGRALARGADDVAALTVLLHDRCFVIAEILNAGVVESRIVEVGTGDLPLIRVMGPPPPLLPNHAASVMKGNNQTSAWVGCLVNEGAVRGPLLAVSRSVNEAMTILDGVHRADAWATRLASGEDDRLMVNLVITRRPTYFEHA